jgi:hypothetical protein
MENEKKRIIKNRYPALLTISKILEIFGWILAIFTLIYVLVQLAFVYTLSKDLGGFAVLGILPIGGLFALFHFALAEIIKVIIDIEYNTRNNSK